MNKFGTKIYFDFDMWDWLQKEAKSRRCSVSHLLRDFVLRAMKEATTS